MGIDDDVRSRCVETDGVEMADVIGGVADVSFDTKEPPPPPPLPPPRDKRDNLDVMPIVRLGERVPRIVLDDTLPTCNRKTDFEVKCEPGQRGVVGVLVVGRTDWVDELDEGCEGEDMLPPIVAVELVAVDWVATAVVCVGFGEAEIDVES